MSTGQLMNNFLGKDQGAWGTQPSQLRQLRRARSGASTSSTRRCTRVTRFCCKTNWVFTFVPGPDGRPLAILKDLAFAEFEPTYQDRFWVPKTMVMWAFFSEKSLSGPCRKRSEFGGIFCICCITERKKLEPCDILYCVCFGKTLETKPPASQIIV